MISRIRNLPVEPLQIMKQSILGLYKDFYLLNYGYGQHPGGIDTWGSWKSDDAKNADNPRQDLYQFSVCGGVQVLMRDTP